VLKVEEVGVALVVLGTEVVVDGGGTADEELVGALGALGTGVVLAGKGVLELEGFGVGTGSCVDGAGLVGDAL